MKRHPAGYLTLACVGLLAIAAPLAAGEPNKTAQQPLDKLVEKLASKDQATLLQAIQDVAEFGPKAAPAVPALIDALKVANEDIRLNAALALGKVGKAAVAPLQKVVSDQDPSVRYYALSALGWNGPAAADAAGDVIGALSDKEAAVRRKAAYALGRIGAQPKQSVSALIEAFTDADSDVAKTAAEAVAQFGKDAVGPLLKSLEATKTSARQYAVDALGLIGADAKVAVPALAEFLVDSKSGLQSRAAEALGKIGSEAIPVLKKALDHADSATRRLALATLKSMGAAAAPTIVDALDAKHVDVRRDAALALGQMQITDKMIVIGLGYALKDKDDLVRQYAVTSLQRMGQSASLAAPHLKGALLDTNAAVGQTALHLLQTLGENPMPGLLPGLQSKDLKQRVATAALMAHTGYEVNKAAPILLDALKAEDKQLRMQAAIALARTGQQTDKVLPVLKEGLKDDSPAVRQQSVAALGNMPNTSEPVVAAIIGALADQEFAVRRQAFYALRYRQNIQNYGDKIVPAFQKLLNESDANFRREVVNSVYSLGKHAVPLYLTALKDKDANVRQYAMWNLQGGQGDAATVIPALSQLVDDANEGVRLTAIQVLGNYGPAAVVPLVKALKHKDATVRQQALSSLQYVSGDLKPALPTLEPLLTDKEKQVRHAAYLIIWRAGAAATGHLTKGLDSDDPVIRQRSLNGLKNLKVDDEKTLKQVAQMAREDKDGGTRSAALEYLVQRGKAYHDTVEKCLRAEKDPNVFAAAVSAIGKRQPLDSAYVPLLIESLKNSSAGVRASAAHALRNIGPDRKQVVAALAQVLGDDNGTVRRHAVNTLIHFGPEQAGVLAPVLRSKDLDLRHSVLNAFTYQNFRAKDAVPALIDLLKDASPNTRWQAAQSLGNHGAQAKEAIPALQQATLDANVAVRNTALQSLQKIKTAQ